MPSAVTVTLNGTITVPGQTTLTSGTLNGTGSLEVQGDLSAASTFSGGTASLLIDGSAGQTFTGSATTAAGSLPAVTINKPSGSLTLAGTIRTTTNWTYLGGTLDPAASTVVFAATLTISGDHRLANVTFSGANRIYTLAGTTTLGVDGLLTLTDGSINTGRVSARGDISQASTFDGGTGSLLIDGSAGQTFTGSATTAAGSLPAVTINKPSGSLTLAGTIRTTTNWTYLGGILDPGASTLVLAGTLTISGSQPLGNLELRGAVTIPAGTILTLGGTFTMPSAVTVTLNGTITVPGQTTLTSGTLNGTGSLEVQGDLSAASTFSGGTASLLIDGSAGQTFTGSATTAAGSLPAVTINKPSGSLTLAGTIRTTTNWTYLGGTLDPAASTVVFAATLTISGDHRLANVTFSGANRIYTLAGTTTLGVDGLLTLTDGSINTGRVSARGDISQASTFDGGTGSLLIDGSAGQTFTGSATTAAGSLPAVTINKPSGSLTLAGTIRTTTNWTYLGGILDPGASTVVFAGGTVTSVGMAFHDVTINGGTTTLGSAMTMDHDLVVNAGTLTTSVAGYGLAVAGRLTVLGTLTANSSAITVGGDLTVSGTFVAGSSLVALVGAGGQTIAGVVGLTFHDLTANDPVGVSLATDIVVDGVLDLPAGLTVGAHRLTVRNPIAGIPTNLAAGATSTIVVSGTAAGIVLPSSVVQLLGLTLADPSGLTISADLDIVGRLTLTSGVLDAAGSTVAMGPAATVTRTSGHVAGVLRKHVPTGTGSSLTFEIGDLTSHTPVAVVFGTVTAAGELAAGTTPGDQPAIAGSGVSAVRGVNRYWTLTNSGVVFDTYDATFTFVPGDVDPGADPLAFIVGKLDGATWILPSVGVRTMTSTQATGLTSFSDFVLGEPPSADLGLTVSDGLTDVVAGDGLTHTYLITVTNGGPSDASGVTVLDSWPAGFAQGTIDASQGSCTSVGPGPDLICALGSLAAGASATVSVDFTVAASTLAGVQLETATVSGSPADPVGANDVATDSTTVSVIASLVIEKSDGLVSVEAGTSGHAYTVTIGNDGPSDAHAVSLSDPVPAALTAGAPSADLSGDCGASAGNAVVCDLPIDLAPGTTWTITIPYAVPAGRPAATVVNLATATSAEDPIGVGATDQTDLLPVAGPTPTPAPGGGVQPDASPGPPPDTGMGSLDSLVEAGGILMVPIALGSILVGVLIVAAMVTGRGRRTNPRAGPRPRPPRDGPGLGR